MAYTWNKAKEDFYRGGVIFLSFAFFATITYAAISWPATPSGETTGGKYSAKLVPSTAVMAFNASSCPTGWSEYTPAYGKFIRWIDKSGTNIDPSGLRAAGNAQADAFQGHWHNANGWWDAWSWPHPSRLYDSIVYPSETIPNIVTNPITDRVNGTPRIANETRPKNVALLYCIKD